MAIRLYRAYSPGTRSRTSLYLDDLSKNKPEKAFKIVNRLVQDYPFDQEFLRFRSQIHRQLGQEQEATADLLKAQNLESSIISSLSFKVFGVTSTRQISGKTF